MSDKTVDERLAWKNFDAAALERHQLARLNALIEAVLPANQFYALKLADVPRPLTSLEQLSTIPFTFKQELHTGGHPDEPTRNHTYPIGRYTRLHQTSGTKGRPLTVLDTADDWQWWLETWQYVFDAAEVTPADRVLAAFSFGPFIGFWSAYEAAAARGALVVPGGGMSTLARLELLRSSRATVLLCTPSYALHLAEVGHTHQIDVASLGLRRLILAGEPGGSIPAIRQRIEAAWRVQLTDHAGATEVGPWGFSCDGHLGLHVIESQFIAEFLALETGGAAADGELAELVLTNLGRWGCPVIRYRTGDLVRPRWNHANGSRFVFLDGGILGRSDDMVVVRGVNIFPSAIDQIMRSFPEVIEYRLTIGRRGEMDFLAAQIEDRLSQPARVREELRLRLGLKVDVECVPTGTLPRFEGKGKRLVDLRAP